MTARMLPQQRARVHRDDVMATSTFMFAKPRLCTATQRISWHDEGNRTACSASSARCLVTSVFRRFKSFLRDSNANVALLFGLAVIPMVGLVGAAVDYSNASRVRGAMQEGFDASCLAGARRIHQGATEVQQAATAFWRANRPSHLTGVEVTATIIPNANRVRVTASGTVNHETSVVRVLNVLGGGANHNQIQVAATSECGGANNEVEIVFVLDNTGSMASSMSRLREFTDRTARQLMDAGPGIRISIVPYAAAVNPGTAALSGHMDTLAESRHHAEALERRQIGFMTGCRWPWDRNPNPNPGGGGGGGGPGRGRDEGGGREGNLTVPGLPTRIGAMFAEILGVRAAHAAGAEITPNTRLPLGGFYVTGIPGGRAFLPTGFYNWNDCGLYNPIQISHFDLFARSGTTWKGCVEARPAPHDVRDTAPSRADANTLFVPYFWADERDAVSGARWNMENDWLADGTLPDGWGGFGATQWERTYSILKYNGVARPKVTIRETGPDTTGPNRACPNPILDLTNDRSRVVSTIAGLTHWNGGGTINSEGLMWGWRVLSPEAPFTSGRPWGQVPKIIVWMSDGQNLLSINGDRDSDMRSDYTAYGYLRNGRFPSERFDDATTFLNQRQQEACTNIKAVRAPNGDPAITLYTILFREREANAQRLMRDCASTGRHYFEAIDIAALDRAFAAIAEDILKLRLTR